PDLVLQTTYEEWNDEYRSTFQNGGQPRACTSCHTNPADEPLVSAGPFGSGAPTRLGVPSHTFFCVGYHLAPGRPGLSDEQFDRQIAEVKQLLGEAVSMNVVAKVSSEDAQNGSTRLISAKVNVTNEDAGHQLPTGFAFVRQMWLEVRADVLDAD